MLKLSSFSTLESKQTSYSKPRIRCLCIGLPDFKNEIFFLFQPWLSGSEAKTTILFVPTLLFISSGTEETKELFISLLTLTLPQFLRCKTPLLYYFLHFLCWYAGCPSPSELHFYGTAVTLHVTRPVVAWRYVEAPNGAEGSWRAPDVPWPHAQCPSHAFPGAQDSTAVGAQLGRERAALLGRKRHSWAWAGRTCQGRTQRAAYLTMHTSYRLLFRCHSTSISLPENDPWLIILAPYIWQFYFFLQGWTLRVTL